MGQRSASHTPHSRVIPAAQHRMQECVGRWDWSRENCTVALSKFQKFSWGGAHRAPSPNPSPRFHSALRASIPRFARTRRFAPRCALRAISALRASVRVSRKLGASRLHANVVCTSNICTAREIILPTPLNLSIIRHSRSQSFGR